MSGYFLISRNRKDNNFRIININQQWYLGDKGSDVFSRENPLEVIDLVTSRFINEEQLASRLAAKGYIDDTDVDIFIVGKQKKDGKDFVRFEEVVYRSEQDERTRNFRNIAYASLNNRIKDVSGIVSKVYDELIEKVYHFDDFYNIVVENGTNIPVSMVKELSNISNVSFNRGKGFSIDNYVYVRNTVEALNRFDMLKRNSMNPSEANIKRFKDNLADRVALIPTLQKVFKEKYCEDQLSFLPMLEDVDNSVVREASKKVVEEEDFVPKKITVSLRGVPDGKKKTTIFSILKRMPRGALYRDDDGKFKVNYDLFEHPLLDEEKKKLDTYLTGNLPMFFADYIINYAKSKQGCESLEEVYQIEDNIESAAKKIRIRFKSAKCLNMAYEWCMLYDGCRKRDASYGMNGSGTGEEEAKTYGKKGQ